MKRRAPARAAIAAAIILLTGCAGLLTDINDARKSWHGARYEDVVEQWGRPSSSARPGEGRESHTWVSEGQMIRRPAIGIFVGSGGSGVSVSPQPAGPPARCERTLVFQDGRVAEQTWEGDENYCSSFIRH